MATELDALYGDIIMDHTRDPRNFGPMENCDCKEEGFNPLCGDRVSLCFRFDDATKKVKAVGFEGQGCSICMASSSILTEELEGVTYDAALHRIEDFRSLMQGKLDPESLEGDLRALAGVRRFPVRIKCALLSWMTAKKILEGKVGIASGGPVTTEDSHE